jgi:hypothetical protein
MERAPYPALLSVKSAMAATGINKTSFYAGIQRGEIPSVRVNGRLYMPTAKFCSWLGVDPVEFFGAGEVSA